LPRNSPIRSMRLAILTQSPSNPAASWSRVKL
jgi:hypothetical protein